MEKSKGMFSFFVCAFCQKVLILTRWSPGHSKKNGSSNGAGSAGNYKHLSMEGSSLSDLDSEDELQIDETPPPRRKTAGKKKKLSSKYLTEGSIQNFQVPFLNWIHPWFFLQVEPLLLKFALSSSQKTAQSQTLLWPKSHQGAWRGRLWHWGEIIRAR